MTRRVEKKIILVNRDFQLRYAYAAAFVGLVSTLVTAFVILSPLYYFNILRIGVMPPLPILSVMFSAIVINVLMIGFFGVYLTHRIAGPMYSLVREMRRIGMGSWGRFLKTRDTDDIQYVIRNFNEMAEGLVNLTREDIAYLDELGELSDQAFKDALNNFRQRFEARLISESSGAKMAYTGDSK